MFVTGVHYFVRDEVTEKEVGVGKKRKVQSEEVGEGEDERLGKKVKKPEVTEPHQPGGDEPDEHDEAEVGVIAGNLESEGQEGGRKVAGRKEAQLKKQLQSSFKSSPLHSSSRRKRSGKGRITRKNFSKPSKI